MEKSLAAERLQEFEGPDVLETRLTSADLVELGAAYAVARSDVILSKGARLARLARRDDGSVYMSATEHRTDYADETLAWYGEDDLLSLYFPHRLLRDLGV